MEYWEIPIIRRAGAYLAEVSEIVRQKIAPGVSLLEINALAEEEILRRRCIPAFKGYRGFPHATCLSVNEQVVHGVPSGRVLQVDDVLSVDLGLVFGGLHADMAFTVVLGDDPASHHLRRATEDALRAGVAAAQPGARVGDVGAAIQSVAIEREVGIVREYVGHGIGRVLHDVPSVPNFGRAGHGSRLTAGMAIAIEPMFTSGSPSVATLPDGWTVVTTDKSMAAHTEHTVLITERGSEILTVA